MIDTHCHLTDPRLACQVEGVLERAAANGVSGMISIGTSVADSRETSALAARFPTVRCAVGIHPNHAHEAELADVPLLEELQGGPAVVAVGEIGLDYHYGTQHRQRQIEVFRMQLQIASDHDRAVVIHCRDAQPDCLEILRGFGKVRAVFHCFTGTAAEARAVLDAGYYLGYTGVITFKHSEAQRQAVALTPMDRLLVETDAPYLSPEPHRKMKVNEPSLVVHVADVVGRVKGIGRAEVDRATTENAVRFFGWR